METLISIPSETCRLPEVLASMKSETVATITFHSRAGTVTKSFAECFSEAVSLAIALFARGLREGDIVAIHGATSYEWLLVDFACVLTGAVSLALYPTALYSRVLSATKELNAAMLFSDDCVRFKEFESEGLRCFELSEVRSGTIPCVGELRREGSSSDIELPTRANPREPFTIVSTSGTLSEPKFFAVASCPLLHTMDQFKELFKLDSRDKLLISLPLAHLPQRMMTYGLIRHGISFVLSSPTKFLADTQQFAPTLHVVVPRMLQYIAGRLSRSLDEKRWIWPFLTVLRRFPKLVYRLIGAKAFGRNARCIFVGSAATPKPVEDLLVNLGCPLYQVYGTTELGIIGLSTPEANRPGTVGRIVEWGKATVDGELNEIHYLTDLPFLYGRVVDGEIRRDDTLRGRLVPTGDAGAIDRDGYLSIKGRLRDFIALTSGKKIFVLPLEEQINRIRGVTEAVIVGGGERHLSAILFADPEVTFQSPALRVRHFKKELTELNKGLGLEEKVRQFLVVDDRPTVENGCMTETLKLRKHVVTERYARELSGYDWV
jgi:long-chain acyl-CoA synthetase